MTRRFQVGNRFLTGIYMEPASEAPRSVRVLCLTHGRHPDPDSRRRIVKANELARASRLLGITEVRLLDLQPGQLDAMGIGKLADLIQAEIGGADALLVVGSSAGPHSAHHALRHATADAARLTRRALYAWLPGPAAGEQPNNDTYVVTVNRARQVDAIACQHSLAADDPYQTWRLQLWSGQERVVALGTRVAERSG